MVHQLQLRRLRETVQASVLLHRQSTALGMCLHHAYLEDKRR